MLFNSKTFALFAVRRNLQYCLITITYLNLDPFGNPTAKSLTPDWVTETIISQGFLISEGPMKFRADKNPIQT